jgi:hypothetical protein
MAAPQALLTVDGEAIGAEEAARLLRQHLGAFPGEKSPWYTPIINEIMIRKVAKREGVADVTDAELQRGADEIRAALGLYSVAETEAWLTAQGITLDDFERGVETNLLAEKWADKVVGGQVRSQFPNLDPNLQRQIRTILMEPVRQAERAKVQLKIGS